MRRLGRIVGRVLIAALALAAALGVFSKLRYGGGRSDFPTRPVTEGAPSPALVEVASLPLPPGNIAVSPEGRILLSIHPEGRPAVKVVEWVDGRAVPYPDASWQAPRGNDAEGRPLPFFDTVLGVRIDRQGRLWTLDNANHGLGRPALLAFDLARNQLVERFDVPPALAPLGSHLNDLQVTPDGRFVLIADASIFGLDPALLVYDVDRRRARRVLAGHPAVAAEPYIPTVGGRRMEIFGLFAIRPGVDSVTLDRSGEWLYLAAVTATRMYRVRVSDLVDPTLSAAALAARVEPFADKPMTDGLSSDLAGNLVLSDFEHDGLLLMAPDGRLTTLLRDPRLRWPDGLSFGPCTPLPGAADCLYVTCSALHRVIGRTPGQIAAAGPYQVFRLRMPAPGIAGH